MTRPLVPNVFAEVAVERTIEVFEGETLREALDRIVDELRTTLGQEIDVRMARNEDGACVRAIRHLPTSARDQSGRE